MLSVQAMEKLLEQQEQRIGPGTYTILHEKQRFRHVDPDAEHGRAFPLY